MLRHFPDKTKIIFFDLEYYVPLESRERRTPGGMTFSPVLRGHKILGGTFQTYFPMLDKIEPARQIWEWNQGSEKAVLESILRLLKHEWRPIVQLLEDRSRAEEQTLYPLFARVVMPWGRQPATPLVH